MTHVSQAAGERHGQQRARGGAIDPAELDRLRQEAPSRTLDPPVAAGAGRRSQHRRAGRPARRIPRDMLLNYAQRHFAEGATAVVTGHFHEPLLMPGEEGTLVALGDWITQYSYAVLENGAFTLHTF